MRLLPPVCILLLHCYCRAVIVLVLRDAPSRVQEIHHLQTSMIQQYQYQLILIYYIVVSLAMDQRDTIAIQDIHHMDNRVQLLAVNLQSIIVLMLMTLPLPKPSNPLVDWHVKILNYDV